MPMSRKVELYLHSPICFRGIVLKYLSKWTTFLLIWRYNPNSGFGLPPCNFTFHFSLLDLRQSAGLLGRVISSSQGLYLYKTQKNAHTYTNTKHPCAEWDSNPRSWLPSEKSACLKVRPHYSCSCWCSPGLCSSGDSSGCYLCS
jgi:hypothetical protein